MLNNKVQFFFCSLFLILYCSGVGNAGGANAAATTCHLYFHMISILYTKQECVHKIVTRVSTSPALSFLVIFLVYYKSTQEKNNKSSNCWRHFPCLDGNVKIQAVGLRMRFTEPPNPLKCFAISFRTVKLYPTFNQNITVFGRGWEFITRLLQTTLHIFNKYLLTSVQQPTFNFINTVTDSLHFCVEVLRVWQKFKACGPIKSFLLFRGYYLYSTVY